ncbi:hypothetical protein [Massilia frigida]|nr:hypothetical protein [Massilia frigida]
MHLMAIPSSWFGDDSMAGWISIFIPYVPNEVSHYARLRAREGTSAAKVIAYNPVDSMRNEYAALNLDAKAVVQSECDEEDDDENLASKLGGVRAWLQKPITVPGYHYAMAIYGGDLDEPLSPARGILSDGLGYLFLAEEGARANGDAGRFFLQLG